MILPAQAEQFLWNNILWFIPLALFIFNGISILVWKFLGWLIKLPLKKKKKHTQQDKFSTPTADRSPLFSQPEKSPHSSQGSVEKSKTTTPQEKLPSSEVSYHHLPQVPVEINEDGYLVLTESKEDKK